MLIGIVGFIGSGKGTVGDILSKKYGYVQDSFAAPLKDAVATIFNWDCTLLEGATKESRAWREQPDTFWSEQFGKSFSPRLALQLMGTEAGRDVFHKDLWVISLLKRSHNRDTVITDVRFKNEVALIKKSCGVVIRVVRGPEPFWFTIAEEANKGYEGSLVAMHNLGIHRSEWDWVGCSMYHTIYNNGTLEDLEKEVDQFVSNFLLTKQQ